MKDYCEYISAETLMGPCCIRILDELFEKHPLQLPAGADVLDLGCGKGLTSLMTARETGAHVTAADLWISAEENTQRFASWGMDNCITPVHADANGLPFEKAMFDAMVSVDSYHYYGGEKGFFEEKILPFMKNGAEILIGIPGIRSAYSGHSEELLADWLGEDSHMFKSAAQWKDILSGADAVDDIEVWEMNCFDIPWDDWFNSGHEFAMGDKKFFDSLIKPFTCFIGIYMKLK